MKNQGALPLIRPVKVQYVTGYFPNMPQSSLLVSLAVDSSRIRSQHLSHAAHIFSHIFPDFTFSRTSETQGVHSLAGQIIDAVSAFLIQAGMPVMLPGFVAKGALKLSHGLDLVLPAIDQHQVATRVGLEWVVSVINSYPEEPDPKKASSSLQEALENIRNLAPRGLNSLRFIQAAGEVGIPWRRVADNIFQFGWGKHARWLDSSFTDQTSVIGSRLARNKILTSSTLQRLGIPVCPQVRVNNADEAVSFSTRFGFPVVIKPADQDGGRGVAVGLTDTDAVRRAFLNASKISQLIILEKQFIGNDYRLQVFKGNVYWIVQRIPGRVVGDGVKTVVQLLEAQNSDPLRGEPGSNSLLKKIYLDEEARELLEEQGLISSDVPALDQEVRLRRAASVSSGGTVVPIMEGAHPDNVALAERAATSLRLDLAGIDLLLPDITQSWFETGAAVCEVNAQPQLYPTLPSQLIRQLVSDEGRVPIVLVLGIPDSATCLEPLLTELNQDHDCIGVMTPTEVRIGSRVIMRAPFSSYTGCSALLSDVNVQACLLFLDNAEFIANGFPFDQFDTLVLWNEQVRSNQVKSWVAWCAFAEIAMSMCTKEIVYRSESKPWEAFSEQHPEKGIISLSADDIVKSIRRTLEV